ncbi:hypothetical protein WR25_13580 [Diploscapter pachys]|uniref:Uncharacterized protein n=1 Tax=Diploscapter pachys TaxID=2018661 RepID=A0A2A2K2U9_9BILA|nr:hypothetical protein WR25_13580 [Diploscapter pachys]
MQAGDRAWIADQDFVGAARGGIAQEGSLDVAVDQPADIAERAGEQPHDRRGLIRGEGGARLHLPIAELTVDLAFQIGEGGGQLGGDEMILARFGQAAGSPGPFVSGIGSGGIRVSSSATTNARAARIRQNSVTPGQALRLHAMPPAEPSTLDPR